MRRWMMAGFVLALGLLAGCGAGVSAPATLDAPWKNGDGVVVTAAPDAGGVLSFRNCPTLTEATAAMPAITGGPDANAVPFKSMVLQCSYALPGRDSEGHLAGIAILVFDARAEGREAWTWPLDADFGTPTAIPNLGDTAFATTRDGRSDLWVDAGRFGLHVLTTTPGLALAETVSLAEVAVAALGRPPR